MKGTVFLEPASTAARYLHQHAITGVTEDGLPFLECSRIEVDSSYLICTPQRQLLTDSWKELVFPAKDVAMVVTD